MKHIYILHLFTLLLCCSITSCDSELEKQSDQARSTAIVTAQIGEAGIHTRAEYRSDDKISYSQFVTDDAIGFFSKGGLEASNLKLVYTDGSFQSPDASVGGPSMQWKEGDATTIFAYYPCTEVSASNNAYDINIWREASSASGTNKAGNLQDGFEDILFAQPSKNVPNGQVISLGFTHHFAMLMIERGDGFDSNTGDISITLSHSISKTAKLNYNNGSPKLLLQKDNTDQSVTTLKGTRGTYKGTENGASEKNCYYILIPIDEIEGETTKLTVTSITLQNNSGRTIHVPFPTLKEELQSNWKQIVRVSMRDNEPQIEPVEIRRWEEYDIHIVKPAGIETAGDFKNWLAAYNTSNEANNNALGDYGTYANNQWTFLLLADIPLNNEDLGNIGLNNFTDILDGQGHSIRNMVITKSDAAGLVGTLSGTIQNVKLENVHIKPQEASTISNGTLSGFGAFAVNMASGGKLLNCHVTGSNAYVFGTGAVGGLAGTIQNGGSITNCTSTALVSGPESNTGLIYGTNSGSSNVNNTTSSGLLIITTSQP